MPRDHPRGIQEMLSSRNLLSPDKSSRRGVSIGFATGEMRQCKQIGVVRRSRKTNKWRTPKMQPIFTRMRRSFTACVLGTVAAVTLPAQSVVTTVSKSPGNSSRTTTVTGANGKTATYQNNAAWENGSYTDSRTITGFDGKAASANTSASYAAGSTARQTTVTDFNGRTATYDNNRSWGNGAYSDTRTSRSFDGTTRSDTVTRSNGIVRNTFTGRNGNSRTAVRVARYRR